MKSITRSMIVAVGLVSLFAAEQALACHALDREIVEVKADKIGGYTEAGKFDHELARADVLNKKVVACSEVNSALAKIMLSDKPIWIDLTEVKLTPSTCDESGAKPTPSSITGVASRPRDTTAPISSGIDGCSK